MEMIRDESRFQRLVDILRKNALIPLDVSKKQSSQYSYELSQIFVVDYQNVQFKKHQRDDWFLFNNIR